MITTAARPPDLIEPIVGYRWWSLDRGALCSPFVAYAWERGVNTARCDADHDDEPPGHACACGLHAWYRPCPRLGYAIPDLVGGAVVLWGAVELHATGMRARHAMVVALALPLAHTAKRRRVLEIARALEVEVVPARQLTAAALRHGEALNAELVPKSP